MMNISRNLLLSLAGASSFVFLTGCGGSSTSKGTAPSTLDGYIVQLVPGTPVYGYSPGTVIVYPAASQSALDTGTVLSAQVVYSPIPGTDNQAQLNVATHTPSDTTTPTTITYSIAVIMEFTDDKTVGNILEWKYTYFQTGGALNEGWGDSGTFKLFLQQ